MLSIEEFDKVIDHAFSDQAIFKKWFEEAPILNAVVSTNGKFIYVNDAWVDAMKMSMSMKVNQIFGQ